MDYTLQAPQHVANVTDTLRTTSTATSTATTTTTATGHRFVYVYASSSSMTMGSSRLVLGVETLLP
jgi:hypothetical protein